MEGFNLTIILLPLLILFSSTDFKHKIIQWNCRGLKPNYNEVSLLISEYNPSVFCFQETFLKPDDNISLKGFNVHNYVHTDCLRPSGGASIFLKSSFPQRKIDLQTELQATAISVTLDREITICSVYIPPSFSLNSQHLDNLLQQLPSPYILLGDFNGHNILWGGQNNDSRGELIENFITKNDICIMNDKSYTYHSPSTKSFTSIDLSFCHPSLFLDYNWSVCEDQHNSDHFPIIIEQNTYSTEDHNPKWKLNRANWDLFNTLCTGKLVPENFKESSDPIADFTSSLIEISKECIPQTSTNPTKSNPWYNDDCKEAIKQRKQALSKFKRSPNTNNFNDIKVFRAKARRTIKLSKRKSWRSYVSKINHKTPIKKVWDMIRKISGKNKSPSYTHLNMVGTDSKATSKTDIADTLGETFCHNSSSFKYSESFRKIKTEQEKVKLNFISQNNEIYNKDFNIDELVEAIQLSHDSATGPDEIHYQMLKHLPNTSLETLLNIFNYIWTTGKFPEDWTLATIIPIPKPGKDPAEPYNYRPIALTSCLCKTLERMINKRLTWFLESNNHISRFQSGFRSDRSTTDNLVRLETFIRDAFGVLSTTLFSITCIINDIVKCLGNLTDCSLYVDDFCICYRSKSMATIERQLQQNLNKIENWATSNGFKFSKSKTQCVHFCQLRKQHDDPVLHLYGSPIPVVEESKFLGILFDRKLSFIPHIKYLKAKCLKALNLLKVLSHTSWGADRTTLLKLYRSLVRSKLDYGCIIYGSARKSYLQMLDPIHNQGLRLALGAFRTSPVASLYVEADEPSLYSRREKLSLQYAIRLAANPSNPAHEVTFPPNYVDLYEQKPKAIKSFGIRISPLLESANIKPQNIEKHFTPNIPAWCMKPPEILFDLHSGKKSESNPHILKDDFRKMQSRYKNYQQIYTDGSKEDSKVGCAVISDNHSNMQRIPDDSSIFTAEAKAIDLALDFISTCDANNKFIIFSDSLSVLKAMNHTSSKNPQIQKLLEKCHELLAYKEIALCWIPSHIGIQGNEMVDKQAKTSLSLEPTSFKIPFSNFKPSINKYILEEWQTSWNNSIGNKLLDIKPTIGEYQSVVRNIRREEVVLARLRLGHTRVTHSYLLQGEEHPQCVGCDAPFTVRHFLLECGDFAQVRNNCFHVDNMKELFQDIHIDSIMTFLRQINLFNKI